MIIIHAGYSGFHKHFNKEKVFSFLPETGLDHIDQTKYGKSLCKKYKTDIDVITYSLEYLVMGVRLAIVCKNFDNTKVKIVYYYKNKKPTVITINKEGQLLNTPKNFFSNQVENYLLILKKNSGTK